MEIIQPVWTTNESTLIGRWNNWIFAWDFNVLDSSEIIEDLPLHDFMKCNINSNKIEVKGD